MPTSYLKKYNDDFNPVNERLELKKKLIIRIAILFVATLAFLFLRITNVHNVFSDVSNVLLIGIYLIMGLTSVISIIGIGLIIFSLVSPVKANELSLKIPFSTKKFAFTTLDWIIYIPICICFALFLYSFAFRIQMVSGPSMESSFSDGDRVISIYDSNIRRGDVVIANLDPIKNQYSNESEYIIKRVIGMPGDKIEYTKVGLFINGVYIPEDYIDELPSSRNEFKGQFTIFESDPNNEGNRIARTYDVIPEGYYFVMGDNRGNSLDSRDYRVGLIKKEDIVGKTIFRLFPFNKIGTVK